MIGRYRFLVVVCLALAVAGCVNLKRDYPQRTLYSLDPAREGVLPAPETGPAVRVQPFKASPGLESTEFIYRTGESTYETDFYHAFFTFPADQVRSAATGWLNDSGLARIVFSRSSSLSPDYVVEGNLSRLHGDFRDRKNPQAVIGVDLLVLDNRQAEPGILLGKSYSRSVTISSASPDALVKGWEAGLAEVLADFEQDFSAALEKARPPAQ